MAAIANLRIDQGANFSSDVTVTNSDGNVVDLTGYTTEAKMAKSYGASDSVTITSALASDPTTGVVELTLTDTQTGILTAGRYDYDIVIENLNNGTKTKVITGQVKVNGTVS